MNRNNLPIEIYQEILLISEFVTQIRLRLVCKKFYNCLEINDFYTIYPKYLKLLNNLKGV